MAKRKNPDPPAAAAPAPVADPIPLKTASCWKCRRHLDVAYLKTVKLASGRDGYECANAQLVKTCKPKG
jgi:hypothetical protein